MLSGLSAPLAAVSTRCGDTANAQIAVAITSASIVLHRPRIIVQLYHTNYTCELVAASGVLAVNFLAPEQLPLIWQLGMRSGRDGDKLADIPLADTSGASELTGSPILAGCFGYLDCRVVNAMDGGDMTAFLADVVSGATWGRNAAALAGSASPTAAALGRGMGSQDSRGDGNCGKPDAAAIRRSSPGHHIGRGATHRHSGESRNPAS